MAQQESVQILQQRLAYEQRLVQLVDRIHAAKGVDSIFIELQGEILGLLDADRMTIYAIDPAKKELYSKFLALDAVKEIRVPVNEKSIAGFVAAAGRVVNVADAYDKAELARISPTLTFDSSWDKKTGFRTQQILAMPIMHEGKPIGVIQLLNKKRGARFTKDDETGASRIAKTLGIAFNNQAQLSQSQELIQAQSRPKTKFDYLLAQARVSPQELSSAVAEARRRQTDVESILIEQYKVPKNEVGIALSQFYECPFVEYDERILPPPDLMKGLRIEYLRRNFWLPLRREDGAVVVLIDNPQDLQRIDSVSQALKNRKVKWAVGLRKDILLFLNQVSGEGASRDSIGTILGDLRAEDVVRHAGRRQRRARRERQRGDSPRQPDHRRRLQGARVRHPHRALRRPARHGDPLSHRRRLQRVSEDPRRLPAGHRRAHQDHGPARHRRAPQAAGRQDQVPDAATGRSSCASPRSPPPTRTKTWSCAYSARASRSRSTSST